MPAPPVPVVPLNILYPNGRIEGVQIFVWDDATQQPLLWDGTVTFSGSLPSTVAGNLTNNNAAPAANNLGVLPAVANAAAPTWSEGKQVLLSTDLAGNLRVATTITGVATAANQTNAAQKTQIVDGSGNVIGATSNALNVNISSGSITNYALETGGNLATLAGGVSASVYQENLKQINAHTALEGGANGSLAVGGTQANNATITANPILAGFEARQDQGGTNATAGNIVRAIADRNGRLIVINPKLTLATSNGTAITTATTTDVVSAPSAGNHLKIYRVHASNSGATATWVYWIDSNGTTGQFPAFLPQNGIVSLKLDGSWELTSAKKLQLKTSAAGNVEWAVEYETVPD